MADNPFDFRDDEQPSRKNRRERGRPRKSSEKGRVTPMKLALIIWGPIAAILVLLAVIYFGCVGVQLLIMNNSPREPDPYTGE